MPFPLGFTGSGADIADIQAAVNKLYTATGASESQTGTVYNATPGTIANGDPYEDALTILANKFDAATGHMHSGAAGDGPILDVVLSAAATGMSPVTGNIRFIAGSNVSILQSGNDFIFSASGGVTGVTSLAASGETGLTGNIVLVAGSGINLSQVGQEITVTATGSAADPTVTRLLSTGTPVGYLFEVTSANATVGATYTNNGETFTVLETIAGAIRLFTLGANAPQTSGTLTKSAGSGDSTITFSAAFPLAEYTTPSGPAPIRLEVELVGGGGGGAGSGTGGNGNGGNGTVTAFGINLILGLGASGGQGTGTAGTGGGYIVNSPAIILDGVNGGTGGYGQNTGSVGAASPGGGGGNSFYGGAGDAGSGQAAAPNSGSGGGGAFTGAMINVVTGGGGGAGGYAKARILSPGGGTIFYFCVGQKGTAGTAGTGGFVGSDGGEGKILVYEIY